MPRTKYRAKGIPTIDVSLIVIRTGSDNDGLEIAVDTSNKLGVEPQTETTDAVKLMKLGRLLAQKPQRTTITGHQLTLTDNVFTPLLMKIFQGGTVSGSGDSLKYSPPVSGSDETGEIFELDAYSAEYNQSGQIVRYEKITYPNCQGTPVTINTEDDVFRLPEYVINSMPNKGQSAYEMSYVTELPDFSSEQETEDGQSGVEMASYMMESGAMGTEPTGVQTLSNISTSVEKKSE